MTLRQLDEYLKQLLKIPEISDISINGIQIGNEETEIRKIALAVDANLNTILKAVSEKVDVLLVHHGIFWGKPFAFKGPDFLKMEALIKNNIALYAVHLPLDIHSPLGNNYQIASLLELKNIKSFGNYHGIQLGYAGETDCSLEQITKSCGLLSKTVRKFILNERKIKKIAVVSGKGGFDILNDFLFSDCDLLVTGELEHSLYNSIADYQVNVISLGHYESEKFGVIALGDHLKKIFGLNSIFIEEQTGF